MECWREGELCFSRGRCRARLPARGKVFKDRTDGQETKHLKTPCLCYGRIISLFHSLVHIHIKLDVRAYTDTHTNTHTRTCTHAGITQAHTSQTEKVPSRKE